MRFNNNSEVAYFLDHSDVLITGKTYKWLHSEYGNT